MVDDRNTCCYGRITSVLHGMVYTATDTVVADGISESEICQKVKLLADKV